MNRLLQRLAELEQAIQPTGRFLVMHENPTRDLDEQIEAFKAENDVTERDMLIVRRTFI
jgi:hypothetical protein